MRSVNKVILIGNLTRDPQVKETQGGQNVVTFGLATNRVWVTKDGQKKSLAEFHNVVAWSRLADKCIKILRKGKLVYVEGYLKTRVFEEEEGKRSYRTEVVIYDMIVLSKREEGEDHEEDGSMDDDMFMDDALPQF
jgi:single-strand DNA-binding protein